MDCWRDAGWSKGQSRDSAAAHRAPSFTPNRDNSIENRPLRALWRQKCVQETKVLQTCAQLRPKIVARASMRAILRVLHNPLGRSGRPLGVQKRSQNSQEARKHLPGGSPRQSHCSCRSVCTTCKNHHVTQLGNHRKIVSSQMWQSSWMPATNLGHQQCYFKCDQVWILRIEKLGLSETACQ